MEFISLSDHPIKKIDFDKYVLGDSCQSDITFEEGKITAKEILVENGNINADDGTVSAKELVIDGQTITDIIRHIVIEQTKIISKNTNLSDYTAAYEIPVGVSSLDLTFAEIGYNPVNENIPQIISSLRIPDNSNILYQFSINKITNTGFTLILSDEIQEPLTFLDIRISQVLNSDQVSEASKVSSGSFSLDPASMSRPDQYSIPFNQIYPAGQKLSVICTLESSDSDAIISTQVINLTHTHALIQFSDDIPNSNYKLLYIAYPVSA